MDNMRVIRRDVKITFISPSSVCPHGWQATHETSLGLSLKGTVSSSWSWEVKPQCEARKIAITVPSLCLHMLLTRCFNLRCLMQFQANLVTSCRNFDAHTTLTVCTLRRCHSMVPSVLLMDCSFLCHHVFHLYKCRMKAGSRCLFSTKKPAATGVSGSRCLFLRTPFIAAAVTACVSAGIRKIQQQTARWKQLEPARKLHPWLYGRS